MALNDAIRTSAGTPRWSLADTSSTRSSAGTSNWDLRDSMGALPSGIRDERDFGNPLERGLGQAVRGMKGSMKDYVAGALDAMGKPEAAQSWWDSGKVDQQNAAFVAPEVQRLGDIHDADTAAQWALGAVGQGAAYVPAAMLAATAGRAGLGRVLGKTAGAHVGGTALMLPTEGGQAAREMHDDPNAANMSAGEKFLRQNAVGGANAALEVMPEAGMVGHLAKRVPITTARQAALGAGKEFLKNSAGEALTEGLQDTTGQLNKMNYDPSAKYDTMQTIDAAAAGGVGAAPMVGAHAGIAHGMDLAASGMNLGVDAVKAGGKKVSDTSLNISMPKAGFGDAFKSYRDHPEMAAIMSDQQMPDHVAKGDDAGVLAWAASKDNAQRDAALAQAQKTVADPNSPAQSVAVAQHLLDNPNDPQVWQPFVGALRLQENSRRVGANIREAAQEIGAKIPRLPEGFDAEQVGNKAGLAVRAGAQTAKTIAEGLSKKNLEPTQADDVFLEKMMPAMESAFGGKLSGDVHYAAASVLKDYVLGGFGQDEHGNVTVPRGLTAAFGKNTHAVIETAYDLLRRQGRTRDIDELAPEWLKGVKADVDASVVSHKNAADVVAANFAPEHMDSMTTSDAKHISDGIRQYLRESKKDAQTEKQLDTWFGTNKDKVLEQINMLHSREQLKAKHYGDGMESDGVSRTAADSDVAVSERDDPIGDRAPVYGYHFGDKAGAPFDAHNDFVGEHMRRVEKALDTGRYESRTDKETGQDHAHTEPVGIVDYARETGDGKALSELYKQHPDTAGRDEMLNARYKVLRSTEKMDDGHDAIDIRASELKAPATIKGRANKRSWSDVTNVGMKDVSSIEHGRVFMMQKDGDEFVTSAQKLISKMWEKKKAGAFEGHTAEQSGGKDMLNMFSAGLSSLLATDKFSGEMEVRMPDGSRQRVDKIEDLPKDFVLFTKPGGEKVTIGSVMKESAKRINAERAEENVLAKDKGGMHLIFRTEKEAQARADKDAGQFAAPYQDRFAVFEKAGAEIRSEKTRKTAGDPGHSITETDEMAAQANEKLERTERSFDELTGAELHPKEGKLDQRQRRIDAMRRDYEQLSAKLADLRAQTGKNAVREGKIRALTEQRNALAVEGKRLAAEYKAAADKLEPPPPKRKFNAEPVRDNKDIPWDKLGKNALVGLEYLNNPPADYTAAQAQKIQAWAKTLSEKIAGVAGDEAADLRYDLKTLLKKADSVLEGDASLGVMDNPRFNAWFGDSKLVNKDGSPQVLYHSTDATFDTFDKSKAGASTNHASTGLGIFLSPDKARSEVYGQHTMELYARMERPYKMNIEEFSGFKDVNAAKARSRELQELGYDGVIVPMDGTTIVFDEHQLKSATDNNGNYGFADANIKRNMESTAIHNELGRAGFAATHDSPHRHEGKFDWRSHQGNGEGNAAFGAGTYLSTANGVHESYKKQFSGEIVMNDRLTDALELARESASSAQDIRESTEEDLRESMRGYDDGSREEFYTALRILKKMTDNQLIGKKSPTYQVSVNIAADQLLDWDKPLGEQSKKVEEAIYSLFEKEDLGNPDDLHRGRATGAQLYSVLTRELGSQSAASEALQSLGILGHKYAASSGKNDTHPNYVIYDDSKITTNYVYFSRELPGDATVKVATPEEIKAAEDHVTKTLGPQMQKEWVKAFPHGGSGEWQSGIIRIATSALNPLSVAHHESMHELFQRLTDNKRDKAAQTLLQAANSPLTVRRLERFFADEKYAAVREAIKTDPEERLAYMYQLWASGQMKFGPETQTIFQKVADFMRKAVGLLTNDQRAEMIMQAFHDGKMAEPSAMAQVLDGIEARGETLKAIGKKMQPVLRGANELIGTAEAKLTGSSNPGLNAVGRLLNNRVGATDKEQGWLQGHVQANNQWLNKFGDALRPTGHTVEQADIQLALEGLQKGERSNDPTIKAIQTGVRKVFDDMHEYLKEADVRRFDPDSKKWVPIEKVTDYFSRSWDTAKLMTDGDKFVAGLIEHHLPELQAIAEHANKEVKTGTGAGDYTASWEKLQKNDTTPVTAEDVAAAIHKRLLANDGQTELSEQTNALGYTPMMKAVNQRTLTWIDMAKFSDFQRKDMIHILTNYVNQATKRAEYARRFGADGSVLENHLTDAWHHEVDAMAKEQYGVEGAVAKAKAASADPSKWQDNLAAILTAGPKNVAVSAEQGQALIQQGLKNLEPARRAVMAMEGTLGHDISPLLRKASAYSIVYQNTRLLAYSMFSNLIDPLGIMVRGGEMGDAYAAFKRGMTAVVHEWGDLTGLRKAKDSDRDEATRIAEMIGTVDCAGFMSTMGNMYGSQFLPGWAKEWNDKFFRWNGMESFNKAMRVQATQAAIGFIKKHAAGANKHSERYLTELGLEAADVKLDADGRLNVEDAKIQKAVMRWVDGAILRPNAAMRPSWMSDPHYAVFGHLKQFMYATHEVLLKRVAHEVKHGNTDGLMLMMAGYVPVMLAADAAKGILQEVTGGGAPMWEHQSLVGVVSHGVQRAGGLGIGQMGVDAVEYGPTSLAGPMVEQIKSVFTKPLRESIMDAISVGPLNILTKGAAMTNAVD